MFLPLEDNDVILTENIVALVRREGVTLITLSDGGGRESVFTPSTLGGRIARLERGVPGRRASRTRTTRTEGN